MDTEHHLIIAHEVVNVGNDRAQLADISTKAKAVLGSEKLDVVADRGYFDSEEILACERAGITLNLWLEHIVSRRLSSLGGTKSTPSSPMA